MLKQLVNRWMIGPASKPWDVCDSRKKDVPTIEGETKIPFLVVIYGSIDFLIWIKVEVEHKSCLLKNHDKSLILRTPKYTYTIPIQSL